MLALEHHLAKAEFELRAIHTLCSPINGYTRSLKALQPKCNPLGSLSL